MVRSKLLCEIPTDSDPIRIDMPPPGVGIKEIYISPGGSGITIVLTPDGPPTSESSGFSLGGGGAAVIGVAVTMSDGSVHSGAVPPEDIPSATHKLNGNNDANVCTSLDQLVAPTFPNEPEDPQPVGVMIDSVLNLKYAEEGVGTLVWGYNVNLTRLAQLRTESRSNGRIVLPQR